MLALLLAIVLSACLPATAWSANTNPSVYSLTTESGRTVSPKSVQRIGNDLYFLGPDCLWWCAGSKTTTEGIGSLILKKIEPPAENELSIPWHEFNEFTYLPDKKALVILDKSGDLFEYLLAEPANKHWQVLRANINKLGQPDPDYVSLCTMNNSILLLDPERNQIWQLDTGHAAKLRGLLPGVLSWKLKAGDINITDAIAINYFNRRIYLLAKNGDIRQYGISTGAPNFLRSLGHVPFKKPPHMRPSRFYTADNSGLYVVERANNRVLKISATRGLANSLIFPATCNLRGLVVSGNGFWIIGGDQFIYKGPTDEITLLTKTNSFKIDPRLKGLILPIAGQSLPGHPGVYPGARRLYRCGVHEGLDFFNQPGAKIKIITGTPVRAAASGKITRIDNVYKDMNYTEYNKVIKECWQTHQTSEKNEDLFRGCQVWIDSNNGLLIKYAHLYKTNNKLHLGDEVKQGDIIGYVGVSGTGENLPGHTPYPHLHFEIWLDGKYLGWGLTPAETISLFEDMFAKGKR